MTTLDFYDTNAARMSATYEQIDFSRLVDRFAGQLDRGARVLEIGCGSGRDAAALLASGFDLTAIDGSKAMIAEAVELHPELAGRVHHVVLPDRVPAADATFAGISAWAVLMHLHEEQLPATFAELARVGAGEAVFAYSVNTQRAGLDENGNDQRGRHFTCLPPTEWEALHQSAGFTTEWSEQTDDLTGRAGIRWVTFIARLQ